MARAGRIRIVGGVPLRGSVQLPPDSTIAQHALVLAALGDGVSVISARLAGSDLATTRVALGELGVRIDCDANQTRIDGRGIDGLAMPAGAIDCGRSPHTLALLAGLLAGQRFGTRLLLDAAYAPRLEHLEGALRRRGAQIAASGATGAVLRPPLAIAPLLAEERLLGIECALPEPDAYAKSAVLLSGLFAAGPTAVSEPLLSPDHLERMLTALGLPLRREGPIAVLDPARWNGRVPALGQLELPGAVSAAACAAAAASVIPNSRIALRDVCSNPTRSGFFDALRLLAARHAVIAKGDRAGREPVAELQVAHATPRGGVLGGEVVLRALDCLPALCLLGARSARGITIADAEAFAPAGASIWSDLAAVVRAFSVDCTIAGAGLRIEPAARVLPAQVDAADDCRLALTAVLFGLAADGETLVDNAACLSDEIPGSIELLQRLGARIELHATDAGASVASHRGDT